MKSKKIKYITKKTILLTFLGFLLVFSIPIFKHNPKIIESPFDLKSPDLSQDSDIYTISNVNGHIWSPDGTQLAYLKCPTGEQFNCELWVADKASSGAGLINHQLISSEVEYNALLDWKDDWILYRIRHEEGTPATSYGRNEIWKIRTDGTGKTQLTFTETNGIKEIFISPYQNRGTAVWARFIPGVPLIYFHAHDGNGWYKTFVCNDDGTDGWYHISNPDYTWRPAVSPTGNKLFWGRQSNFGQPTTHKSCNIDGSGRFTIKAFSSVIGLIPLADGNTLVWHENDNLYAMEFDGTNERTVLADEHISRVFNYDPIDEQGFLMGSNRSDGNMHIYKIRTDGTGIEQLTDGPYLDEVPNLSPDGEYLSYLRLPYDFDKGSSTLPYPYELVIKVTHYQTPSLNISSPDGMSSWETDTTESITWTSTGSISNVKIELYENDIYVMDINATTANDGDYSWLIPISLVDSTLYQIKISDALSPTTYDFSEYFEIFNPAITITSPDGMSSWETDTTESITWTSTGSISDVKIELYENDVYVMDITASTANDGDYSWLIPTSLADSTLYQIKISGVSNPAIEDFSEYFEIFTPIIDSLTVLAPNSTSIWEKGTSKSIIWTSKGSISNVKIDLYKGGVFIIEIVATTPNDGEYTWDIPKDLEEGIDYQIRISDVLNPVTYDTSPYFVITPHKEEGPPPIPGYNLFILISIICIVSIVLLRIRKKF